MVPVYFHLGSIRLTASKRKSLLGLTAWKSPQIQRKKFLRNHFIHDEYAKSLLNAQPQLYTQTPSHQAKPNPISPPHQAKRKPHLAPRPKLAVQRIRPSVLASSEPVHAGISAVIHPVVDGVNTAARASVLADRAAGSRGSLRRGVADLVAGAGAAALEDVVEAEPVADFVGGGGALVVGGGGAAGQGVGQVDAAVEGEVGGGRAGGGEVAPAEGG
jgi:hypothetical protein